VEISRPLVFVLFAMFDPALSMRLDHDNFVKLLRPHAATASPQVGPEGLQLGMLCGCLAECGKGWLDGTLVATAK
jgi:hypothetical protein